MEEEDRLFYCPKLDHHENYYPWLLTSHGAMLNCQNFFDLNKNRCYTRDIKEMRGKCLFGDSNGWLILIDFIKDNSYLLNLVSRAKIQLPNIKAVKGSDHIPPNCITQRDKCILSKLPEEDNCHILFISDHGFLHFCKLGDEKFIHQRSCFENNGHLVAATTVDGTVFGLLKPSYQLVFVRFFDSCLMIEPMFKPFKIPPISPSLVKRRSQDYFLKSKEKFLYIVKINSRFFTNNAARFQIFEIDADACRELTSLDGLTVFLSNGSCCVVSPQITDHQPSKLRILPNCIYFVEPGDKFIRMCNLEDNSITTLPPPSLIVKHELLMHSWLMLN